MIKNREGWLTNAVHMIDGTIFKDSDTSSKFRISCSWPGGKGRKKTTVGQCWGATNSAGGIVEMFISPVLADPVAVLDVVVHENVHRIVGVKCGHRGAFKRLAESIGLTGKMTSTVAGPELEQKLREMAVLLGPYTHDVLRDKETTTKKQGTRMLKFTCPSCPNIARQSREAAIIGLICAGCMEPLELNDDNI